jgi:hypothetical protein
LIRHGSTAQPFTPIARPTFEIYPTQPEDPEDFVTPYSSFAIPAAMGMIARGFAHVSQYDLPIRLEARN